MRAGDKLTVFIPSNGKPPEYVTRPQFLRVYYKHVDFSRSTTWFVWIDQQNIDGFSKLSDEGVLWCRGWDEESAKALEVAHALTPEAPKGDVGGAIFEFLRKKTYSRFSTNGSTQR